MGIASFVRCDFFLGENGCCLCVRNEEIREKYISKDGGVGGVWGGGEGGVGCKQMVGFFSCIFLGSNNYDC